ncbi:DNA repair protein RadC [Magnetospira sp. QH-2]|uniref:RadC family protein n=1 Tax=Magnetospira sp. (strain QH-2) TaxID=1288970 RepID=UPI003528C01F
MSLAEAGLILGHREALDGQTLHQVSGNTHPHRHALRAAGGTWDKMKQVWVFTGTDPTAEIARQVSAHNAQRGLAEDGVPGVGHNHPPKPHYHGHRQRLRERFMEGDAGQLPDYELLELLLFFSIPRVDVKPLAKDLLERFDGLGGVMAADPERLAEFDKINQPTAVLLRAVRDAALRLGREEIMDRPLLASWQSLIDYLRAAMAHETRECFRVVFLNRKNEVIADEEQQRGTVDHTPVYPREVVKRALDLGATAIILVHNHPSGDPSPSRGDIDMTKEIAEAARLLGIVLHDHVIISRRGHSSFKQMGLL